MGRRKLWFERDNYYIHYTEKYKLARSAESGWQLIDNDTTIYSWSPRKKRPPFTEANKHIKMLAGNIIDKDTNTDTDTDTGTPESTVAHTQTDNNFEILSGDFEV